MVDKRPGWTTMLDDQRGLQAIRSRGHETSIEDLWMRHWLDREFPDMTDLMGYQTVQSVIDVATGDGLWMRRLTERRPDWLNPQAQVLGVELARPTVYEIYGHRNPSNAWKDMRILEPQQIEATQAAGTVDLVHEAFFAKEGIWDDHEKRFDLYDRWLRPGGFVLLAHHEMHGIGLETLLHWLDNHQYGTLVLRNYLPPHYPLSFWGQRAFAIPGWFLILAKKPLAK